MAKMKAFLDNTYKLCLGYLQTFLIVSFLLFILFYFYLLPLDSVHQNIILSVVALSVLTDGVFLFLHLPRKQVKHKKLSFDPEKLTVIIACYNGQDVIGDTIENALVHVKPEQIIVVSDASTDKTAETARAYGVRVFENERNLNKAFSVSFVMYQVKTPYVLILDDDTLIGKTLIPTSLLDEGYDAVAFNVTPVKTNTLVNKLQTFEYRKSMIMGKSLRGSVGAVGNISGAIGLYRTSDLMEQVTKHSGQFGGEDQQRTVFVHLYGRGKGVTFTEATVLTKAPDTIKQLFRQRSFRWNLSLPELFFVYSRILVSPRFHFLLKMEKAYQMYLLITDPLKMIFFWMILFHPLQALILYVFYVFFTFVVWLKIGRKNPLWLIFIFPVYSLLESVCRFIAHFYWFKIKYVYLFQKKYHKLVADRNLLWEYGGVLILLIVVWSLSVKRFSESTISRFSSTVASDRNSEILSPIPFGADQIIATPLDATDSLPISTQVVVKAMDTRKIYEPKKIKITVERGDGLTNVARKAIDVYIGGNGISLTHIQGLIAENSLKEDIRGVGGLFEGQAVEIEESVVEEHIRYAIAR